MKNNLTSLGFLILLLFCITSCATESLLRIKRTDDNEYAVIKVVEDKTGDYFLNVTIPKQFNFQNTYYTKHMIYYIFTQKRNDISYKQMEIYHPTSIDHIALQGNYLKLFFNQLKLQKEKRMGKMVFYYSDRDDIKIRDNHNIESYIKVYVNKCTPGGRMKYCLPNQKEITTLRGFVDDNRLLWVIKYNEQLYSNKNINNRINSAKNIVKNCCRIEKIKNKN